MIVVTIVNDGFKILLDHYVKRKKPFLHKILQSLHGDIKSFFIEFKMLRYNIKWMT